MEKKRSGKSPKKTGAARKTRGAAPQQKEAAKIRAQRATIVAVVAQSFTGTLQFPGTFAFLEKFNIPDWALLQEDDPFTGIFDELTAKNTCINLQSEHQSGDTETVSGKIVTCDVDGRETPVLFLFD